MKKSFITVVVLSLFLVPLDLSANSHSLSVDYNYDTSGRLVYVDYSSDAFIEYRYDSQGNLLEAYHNQYVILPPDPVDAVIDFQNSEGLHSYTILSGFYEGQVAKIQIKALPGFEVDSNVMGNCPSGQWVSADVYQTGVLVADCELIFAFKAINSSPRRRGLPVWLYVQ